MVYLYCACSTRDAAVNIYTSILFVHLKRHRCVKNFQILKIHHIPFSNSLWQLLSNASIIFKKLKYSISGSVNWELQKSNCYCRNIGYEKCEKFETFFTTYAKVKSWMHIQKRLRLRELCADKTYTLRNIDPLQLSTLQLIAYMNIFKFDFCYSYNASRVDSISLPFSPKFALKKMYCITSLSSWIKNDLNYIICILKNQFNSTFLLKIAKLFSSSAWRNKNYQSLFSIFKSLTQVTCVLKQVRKRALSLSEIRSEKV